MAAIAATSSKTPTARVFLSAADLSEGCRIAKLSHPRTAQPFSAALTSGGARLLEVQKFQEPPADNPRSWLLAGSGLERVNQDGSLFVATPLDPLFLLLPPLRTLRGAASENRRESMSAGVFRPLSDLASEAGEPEAVAALEATVLAMPDVLSRLRAICDVNDKYDEPMIRLNDDKVLSWLQRKARALAAHLASDASAAHLAARKVADAHSSQFDDETEPRAAATDDDHLAVAVALVCEWLAPEVQAALCSACGVAEAAVSAQRGKEKKGAASQPSPSLSTASSAGSSWATSSWAADLADAEAEVPNR